MWPVLTQAPLVFEAHGEGFTRGDAAAVEGSGVRRGVGDVRRIREDHPGALGNFKRVGVKLEMVDVDRLGPAGRGRSGRGGGCRLTGDQYDSENE